MNSKLRLSTFKALVFMQSLCTILLAANGMAAAAGSGTAPNDVKDTNYPIPAGAFFVAPNGKETDYGRDPNAPTTIGKAINRAATGGTIVFRGGTYYNVGKTYVSKKLTLQAYPREKVWIKGSTVVQDWGIEGAYWVKTNWNYSFPPNVESGFIDSTNYPMAGYRDMVYINGVPLKQVATLASVGPGKFYVDSTNKRLYIGDNPTAKTVEATTQEQGLVMYSSSTSSPEDTVLRGIGFAHYAEQAVAVGVPRVTLENNTFVWNGATGAFYAGGADGIVRGNTFAYNGRKGFGGDRAHRVLVEGNTFSYNNQEQFKANVDAAGVKFIRSDGFSLRDNLAEYNLASGIWIDGSSSNAKIVRNILHHNSATGIWFEISHNGIIGANVVYSNIGAGIYLLDASSTRVFNNTLANNSRNLRVYDLTRKNTDATQIAAGITWISRNNVFKNNILSNTTSAELFEAWNCDTKEPSSLMISYSNYNAYYRTLSSTPPNVIEWSLNSNQCAVMYPTIAAFRSATGGVYEANALVIDNVPISPFFVNEAIGDFRLKTGSPAIGRGDSLTPDSAAAIGVPAGVPLDLGALQATQY